MNKDILLKLVQYLPKRTLFYIVASGMISPVEVLFPGKWKRILLKCNTMSTQRHYLVYKVLLKNGYKTLAFQLANYTTEYKRKRLFFLCISASRQ